MEGVEGMMKSLKLSTAEKKGVRIKGRGGGERSGSTPIQAMGKLFSEKTCASGFLGTGVGKDLVPNEGD
jgi:hypothetical protein